MPQKRNYVTRTYNLDLKTPQLVLDISVRNRDMDFGKVVDWAVEVLHEQQFGAPSDEPTTEREEMDRR